MQPTMPPSTAPLQVARRNVHDTVTGSVQSA
jgi:hypothetical protein